MLGFVVSSFKFSCLREGTCTTFGFIQVRDAHRFVVPCWSSSYLIKVCTKLIAELRGEDLKQQQNKLGRGLESFLANFEVKLTAFIWTKLPVALPQAFQQHFISAGFPATDSLAPGRICRILSLSLSQGGSHQANIQCACIGLPKNHPHFLLGLPQERTSREQDFCPVTSHVPAQELQWTNRAVKPHKKK